MVTLGLETVLISSPGQSDALAFGGDPVRRSLVGSSVTLGVGLVTGGAIRARVSSLRMILKPIKNLDTQ